MMRIKYFISFLCILLFFFACKKDAVNTTNTNNNYTLPDTIVNGTVIFNTVPHTVSQDGVTIEYIASSPCHPSNEIYFFNAVAPGITDTLHTVFSWYFEETGITLLGKKVQYIYARAGTHKVILEVKTNGNLITSITLNITAFGQKANNREVDFHVDMIDNNRRNFLSFSSKALDPIDGYINARYWDFNDGTNSGATFQQHEFPKVPYDKDYAVKLFINNSSGCKDSVQHNVFVPATYYLPCNFTYTTTSACKPSQEEFTFVADVTGVPATAQYLWDFKDYIQNVPGQTVKHKYTYPNTYDVELIIMDNGRKLCSDTTRVIALGQDVTPIAFFYATPVTTDSTKWFFNNHTYYNNGNYLQDIVWDFGDGNTAHPPADSYNVDHVYASTGTRKTYQVTMHITAKSGCQDSYTTTAIVP